MTRQWETIREYKEIKYELYDNAENSLNVMYNY